MFEKKREKHVVIPHVWIVSDEKGRKYYALPDLDVKANFNMKPSNDTEGYYLEYKASLKVISGNGFKSADERIEGEGEGKFILESVVVEAELPNYHHNTDSNDEMSKIGKIKLWVLRPLQIYSVLDGSDVSESEGESSLVVK